jgi:hypothetical protein
MSFRMSNLIAVQAIAITSFTILPIAIAAFTPKPSLAQNSDVNVTGPTVNCEKPNARVSAPNVRVSAPNPSRLVPNVGKLLREGVGVPAPDAEAPDVDVPNVSASAPDAQCADVNDTSDSPSTNGESNAIQGLW